MNQSPLHYTGLIAFWDFNESAGSPRVSRGLHSYRLAEGGSPVERVAEGIFGAHAARFSPGHWLEIRRKDCPALNLRGPHAQVTLLAWIKRERHEYGGCQAIAGMWNEHGRRQYCLFLNLHIHDSREQVGAHISNIGDATPGYKYCMDAAIGATAVPFDEWHCIAMTYDGEFARSYLDGRLDERGDRNPYRYPGGLFDGGDEGADFTVGAVRRPETVDESFRDHGSIVANPYCGLLGGLAVFDRALSAEEIAELGSRPRDSRLP